MKWRPWFDEWQFSLKWSQRDPGWLAIPARANFFNGAAPFRIDSDDLLNVTFFNDQACARGWPYLELNDDGWREMLAAVVSDCQFDGLRLDDPVAALDACPLACALIDLKDGGTDVEAVLRLGDQMSVGAMR